MNKLLQNKKLSGSINIPQSKTHIHRLLFCFLLSKTHNKIYLDKNAQKSFDINETLNILTTCGCLIEQLEEDIFLIDSSCLFKTTSCTFEILESGTTLRIGIPILLYLFSEIKINTTKRLIERSIDFYESLFKNDNIECKLTKNNEIILKGDLEKNLPNVLVIEKISSSQYISGLMYIIPLITSLNKLIFKKKIGSWNYILVTKNILKLFNIEYDIIELEDRIILTYTGKKYKSMITLFIPEIDYSLLSYWEVANCLGNDIKFLNYENSSLLKTDHPDAEFLKILQQDKGEINIDNYIDCLPILLVYACFRKDQTIIKGFERAKIKESNRVDSMLNVLRSFGAHIEYCNSTITVKPHKLWNSKKVLNSAHDHRVAMSIAILKTQIDADILLEDSESVQKSYYYFWQDYERLGKRNAS